MYFCWSLAPIYRSIASAKRSLLPHTGSPLCLNLLAFADMIRICRSLTLNAAVPIEVTSTTALGCNAYLFGTVRVGAGLGRPVAGTALVFLFRPRANRFMKNASRQVLQRFVFETDKATRIKTSVASSVLIGKLLFHEAHNNQCLLLS